MIQWVYELAKKSQVERVVVATDDARIEQAVAAFGGEVVMTSAELQSGTDRVAAVADQIDAEIYVNVQGDEPLLEPAVIDATVELVRSGSFEMASAVTPLRSRAELETPSVVKALWDSNQRAVYFSRFPIPYSRGQAPSNDFVCARHLGLYVYTKKALMRFRAAPPSPLEKAESLEQLRALDLGMAIGLAKVQSTSSGVDTPEDVERTRQLMRKGSRK